MNIKEKLLKLQNGEKSQKIASYIALCFFSAFNICFFIPMDISIANARDIAFPLKTLAIYMGILTLCVFAVLFLICMLTKGKANTIFRSIVFGISMGLYVQGNFLATNLGQLDGSQFEVSAWKSVLDAAVWIVISAAPFFIMRKFPNIFDNVLSYIPVAVIVIQVIALAVSALIHMPAYDIATLAKTLYDDGWAFCSTEGLDLYSQNKNLIVLLADEYDSFYFDNAIKEDPDSVSEFDGFTYYSNTVGAYCLTHSSIAYITTGKPYTETQTLVNSYGSAYVNGYSNRELFDNLSSRFKTNFYCDTETPPAAITAEYSDNIVFKKATLADAYYYSYTVYQISLFRCMPEFLKSLFWYGGQQVKSNLNLLQGIVSYEYDNMSFYNNMPRELRTTNEDVFKFIYILGLHNPRYTTKDLNYTNQPVSPEEEAIAVNKIVNEYLKVLKENGVYDNSDILFLADHGLTGHEDKKYPLLMYKPANQTESGIKISNAPISHDDLYPTLIMLSGGEPKSRTIFEIAEDEQRVRHFIETNENVIGNIKGDYEVVPAE